MAKILYVEDHPAQRDVMTYLLTWGGFEVSVASNGLEGVDKAISWLPNLILMDLRMPGMGGLEAIKKIRSNQQTANIPIITLSAWASGNHKKQALRAGANAHITKPVDLNQLLAKIRAYLTD